MFNNVKITLAPTWQMWGKVNNIGKSLVTHMGVYRRSCPQRKGLDRLLQFCSDWLCKLQLPSPCSHSSPYSPLHLSHLHVPGVTFVCEDALCSQNHTISFSTQGWRKKNQRRQRQWISFLSPLLSISSCSCVCVSGVKEQCPHKYENRMLVLGFPFHCTLPSFWDKALNDQALAAWLD